VVMNEPFSVTKKECNCESTTFDRRSQKETSTMTASWRKALDFVIKNKLTFISKEILRFHKYKLLEIETNGVPGSIFECGVAKAGSSITFAAIKSPGRCLHLFDTFEGIPKPSERDGEDVIQRYAKIQEDKQSCLRGGKCNKDYYGNMDNLLFFVYQQFHQAGYPPEQNSVSFHKGLFDDTVWPDGPIAYAHLDGDWYDSTMNMLKRISPNLSVGGYFILDDVLAWSGATKAYIDFFDVDLDWLQKRSEKKCFTTRDGKNYRVFLEQKAGAQVLAEDDSRLVRCVKKPTKP
jgi:hypothetical protein